LFVVLCFFIITFYGGGFSTVPAYLRDLFGTYQVGAIHGRLLTAWSTAGVLGPLIVNGILDSQGKPGNLVASDYRPALFTMVGVLIVGFVANLLIRPVADRWHEKSPVMDAVAAAHRPAPTEDVAVEPEDIPIVEEELVIAERPHPQNSYRN
jgi:MFS family permease